MKEFYLARMKEGWSLADVDEWDFFYYLDLLAYKVNNDPDSKKVYVNQIF
jgi:hypothetical protein